MKIHEASDWSGAWRKNLEGDSQFPFDNHQNQGPCVGDQSFLFSSV